MRAHACPAARPGHARLRPHPLGQPGSRGRCGQLRSHRLPVVATSEFWWEEEEEFDALTEVLLPKEVVCCTPAACRAQLQQLSGVRFVAAFASPALQQEAAQLWEQLGRAGPPLFLKVRARAALETIEQGDAAAAAAACDELLRELTGQSWRMDLDYGLSRDVTLQAATEQLLVLLGSTQAVDRLARVAAAGAARGGDGADGASGTSSGGSDVNELRVLAFSGWNSGETQQQLRGWQQLAPRVSSQLAASSTAAGG